MTLWRDPLDELIDGLERSVATSTAGYHRPFDLVLMQRVVGTILFGSEEAQARMETEPWYHEWQRQWGRFTASRSFVHGTADNEP